MKMNRRLQDVRGVYAAAALTACTIVAGGLSSRASAAVIEVDDYSQTAAYPVANDDLLQTSATLTSESGISQSGSSVLTDGLSDSFAGAAGGHVLYTLDTAAHPAGYTITNINIYGGWVDNGRDNQKLVVSYATVDDPDTFINLRSIDYNPPATGSIGSSPVWTFVGLSSDDGPLADRVAKVQFTFQSAENGFSGYRELDVLGGAAIPEPASLSILALGALGLLTRRRKADLA